MFVQRSAHGETIRCVVCSVVHACPLLFLSPPASRDVCFADLDCLGALELGA
jgi:hypothetical protein